jgi:hypothetical protein
MSARLLTQTLLLALAGCAGVPHVPLTPTGVQAIKGRDVVVLVHETPDFAAMTPAAAGLIGGLLGAAVMISEGNSMVRRHSIEDPAPALAQELGADLKESYGVRLAAKAARPDSEDLERLARANIGSDYALEISTITWGIQYFATSWNRYRVVYHGRLRLIDLKRRVVVAQASCLSQPEQTVNAPTYEETTARNAAFIKRELKAVIERCGNIFRTQTLLLAAKAQAPGATMAAPLTPPSPTPASARVPAETPPAAATRASRTPLPDDVQIVAAGATVPAPRAAFLGTWAGRWIRGFEHTLIVEKIDGDTAFLIYSWGGAQDPRSGFRRSTGSFPEERVLRTKMDNGAEVVYRLAPDGRTLEGEYSRDNVRLRGRFTRE